MAPTISDDLRTHRIATREFARTYRATLGSLDVAPACGAGCSTCCTHDSPPVAGFEIEILVELIRRRADLADVPAKIAAQVRRLDDLAASDNPGILDHRGAFPCVFLGDAHECRVYDHRPLACVVTYSESREECERAARENDLGPGRGWDVAAASTARVLVRVMRRVSPRTRGLIGLALDRPPGERPPPLVLGLAIMWSPETKAALDAAAAKATAAVRAREERTPCP